MRIIIKIWFILICLCLTPTATAQTSLSGKQDITELMTLAKESFDLSKQDAVILFEGKKLYWLEDGRLIDFIHRIIWINSNYAIDLYGDHRIPYDSKHCDFHVATVRTWMDNQWWETGETGIVETTPYVLERAYDYTTIREMMLLHSSIELPCILEVAYYIEDKEPFRKGVDGLWTFAKEEPVVWSWFGFGVPQGTEPQIKISEGIAKPDIENDERYNLDVYWWKTELLDRTQQQRSENFTTDVPYIAYSTWNDWQELGLHITKQIEGAINLDNSMKKSLDSLLVDTQTDIEQASLIGDFIKTKVRSIKYDNRFWSILPRNAIKTFNTAYGHNLDRTILAMSLLQSSGFKVEPIFIVNYYGTDFVQLPTTATMQYLGLLLSKNDLKGYYNPYKGSIEPGTSVFNNRLSWIPSHDDNPVMRVKSSEFSSISIKFDLDYNKKDKKLEGNGVIYANNEFCPYKKMMGAGDETKSYLNRLVSSIIDKSKIENFNPLIFNEEEIKFAFEFEITKMETDSLGRFHLELGIPVGTIVDLIPDGIELYRQSNETVINFPGKLIQNIELKLNLDDVEIIYSPDDLSVTNDCGDYKLNVSKDENSLILSSELVTSKSNFKPKNWSNLRKLLLAETNEHNNTVIFKTKSKDKKGE